MGCFPVLGFGLFAGCVFIRRKKSLFVWKSQTFSSFLGLKMTRVRRKFSHLCHLGGCVWLLQLLFCGFQLQQQHQQHLLWVFSFFAWKWVVAVCHFLGCVLGFVLLLGCVFGFVGLWVEAFFCHFYVVLVSCGSGRMLKGFLFHFWAGGFCGGVFFVWLLQLTFCIQLQLQQQLLSCSG